MKKQTMLLAALGVVMAFFAFAPMSEAAHVGGGRTGTSDTFYNSDSKSLGMRGLEFKSLFVRMACNGTDGVDTFSGCGKHATHALSAWMAGGWFEPRGGTNFMPPSGDHHRSGWRIMFMPAFSAGSWLAGFGGQTLTFPWYPTLNQQGAGEAPLLILAACNAGMLGTNGLPRFVPVDVDGDGTATCQELASQQAISMSRFLDNHGEPLTPGRFPRYIPHERQSWIGTVVTKYTASPNIAALGSENNLDGVDPVTGAQIAHNNTLDAGDNSAMGARINQMFTSMFKTISDRRVTWFSMSDQNGGGCAGGWCQWLWDPTAPADERLMMAETGPGNPEWVIDKDSTIDGTADGNEICDALDNCDVQTNNVAAHNNITTTNILNDVSGTMQVANLNNFQKAPTEIYQLTGQFLENGLHDSVQGDSDFGNQNFWQEFWTVGGGANSQSLEGVNPNTWYLCGTGPGDVTSDCTGAGGPADFDGSPFVGGVNNNQLSITAFGTDIFQRWGTDSRPAGPNDLGVLANECNIDLDADGNTLEEGYSSTWGETGGVGSTIAEVVGEGTWDLYVSTFTTIEAICDAGLGSATVVCIAGGDTDGDPRTSACESIDNGADGSFGNGGFEVIYTKEVVEAGLRGYMRLDRHYMFAFTNGLSANFGTDGGNDGMHKSMRTMVSQLNSEGFLMSCMNCEASADHTLPQHELKYEFDYAVTFPSFIEEHPASSDKGQLRFVSGTP